MKTADDALNSMEDEREALIAAMRGCDSLGKTADAVLAFYETKHARLYRMWNDKLEGAAAEVQRAVAEEQEAIIRFFSLALSDTHTWSVGEIVKNIRARQRAGSEQA